MRKILATSALAAIPALLLSACNGGTTGSSAMTPTTNGPAVSQPGRVRHLDNGPQDLHAGGATFPAYGYNLGSQPVGYYYDDQPGPGAGSVFATAPTKGTVYYCLTGSGDGRKAFEDYDDSGFPPTGPCAALGDSATGFGGRTDPLDFVGSDVAMPSTECCATDSPYYENRDEGSETWGQPFELPTFGGPIVFGFNASSFQIDPIKFSTWTYCAIANGTIANWDDPAITADNGGKSVTGGVSETLDFYFRSDSSGTSYLFTNKLNNSTSGCNQTFRAPYTKYPYASASRSAAWTFGVSMIWPGPGSSSDPNSRFTGENGNPGVLAGIEGNPWGTGYLEGAWAASAGVGQATLQNGFNGKKPNFISPTDPDAVALGLNDVKASDIDYGEGSDGNSLGSSTPWCQLYIPPSAFVSPKLHAYPIVGLSYWLFYGKNNGVHLPDKTTLIKYITSTQVGDKVLKPLEYTPLTTSIHNAIRAALKGKGSQAACLQ